jgi:hypothetical protein
MDSRALTSRSSASRKRARFLHGERAIGNERMRTKVYPLDPACPFVVRFYI